MKLELKNVYFSERMSEETNAFTADLFIDGKKVAYVKDDGQGGCIDYRPYDTECGEKVAIAEAHFLSLPRVTPEGYSFDLQPTLEHAIGDLFDEWLDKKEVKKFEANMKKGLLFGTDRNSYSIIGWKGVTLEQILKDKNTAMFGRIKQIILEYKAKGKNILNTNIPEELLK